MSESALSVAGLTRIYSSPAGPLLALSDVSFSVGTGEFVALMGPSGCGKSTLLNILGLADRPTSGSLAVAGSPIRWGDEGQLTSVRRTCIGYIFQQFNLLPTLTAIENVMLPALLSGRSNRSATDEAKRLLDRVGLGGKEHKLPATLSGGEMQRVAVARAIVHRPRVVIADEPTGNLDSQAGREVLALLSEIAREGTSIIMATHNDAAQLICSRTIRMRDGRLLDAHSARCDGPRSM